jgi:hypothetical protein
MPALARLEALSTTAELLFTAAQIRNANSSIPIQVVIKNVDGAITVYVGGSTVTNAGANGFEILAGATLSFEINSHDELVYAVAASGTPSIRILAIGPSAAS